MISLPHDQQCMFTPTPSVSVPCDTEITYGALEKDCFEKFRNYQDKLCDDYYSQLLS